MSLYSLRTLLVQGDRFWRVLNDRTKRLTNYRQFFEFTVQAIVEQVEKDGFTDMYRRTMSNISLELMRRVEVQPRSLGRAEMGRKATIIARRAGKTVVDAIDWDKALTWDKRVKVKEV